MTDVFEPTSQTAYYQEQLRRLLDTAHLPECPVDWSKTPLDLAAREQLEGWILSLNDWYYRRFDETFFPWYKARIAEEINGRFDLYQDQQLLAQQMLFAYKYDAQLYNQLSRLLTRLAALELALQQSRMQLQAAGLRQCLKLVNQTRSLSQQLTLLSQELTRLSQWAQQAEIRLAFKQFPGHFSLLPVLNSYQPEDRKTTRFLQNLQLFIQLRQNLVQQLKQMTPENFALCQSAVQSARNESKNLQPDKKLPLELRHWYRQYFCPQDELFLQNIESRLLPKAGKLAEPAVLERYEGWLTSLLVILRRLWLNPSGPAAVSLPEMLQYALPSRNADTEQKELKALLDAFSAFLQTIQPGAPLDAAILLAGLEPLLPRVRSLMQRLLQSRDCQGSALAYPLQEVNAMLAAVEFTFDEIAEGQEAGQSLAGQLSLLQSELQTYRDRFEDLKEILSRQLQPRTVERTLKSLPFKLERWSIPASGEIPPEAAERLKEHRFDHLLPAKIPAGAGEIFLLQAGSLSECVMPEGEPV